MTCHYKKKVWDLMVLQEQIAKMDQHLTVEMEQRSMEAEELRQLEERLQASECKCT